MNAAQKKSNDRAYGRLLSRALPRAIRTDSQLEAMTAELLRLDELEEAGKATPAEQEFAELLTALIEKYEETHYPVTVQTPPHQNLAAIMEHRGIGQAEIARIIGSRPLTSEILNGKRAISKAIAKRLSEALRAPVELFL
jgi:HTH-type transcriptional regulator/antitoxin HigA